MVTPQAIENVVRFEPLNDDLLAEVRSVDVKQRIARILDIAAIEFDSTDFWQALIKTKPRGHFRHVHTVRFLPAGDHWHFEAAKLTTIKTIAGFRVRKRLPTATVGLYLARHTPLDYSEIFHQHLLSVKAARAICSINGSLTNPATNETNQTSGITGVNIEKGDGSIIGSLGLIKSEPTPGMIAAFNKFKDEPFAPAADRVVDIEAAEKVLAGADRDIEDFLLE